MAIALSACGPSLDRRDGSLVIQLSGMPASADELELELITAERTFAATFARRPNDVISDFTAVPAGSAVLNVVVLGQGRALTSRQNIPVEIVEGEKKILQIELASGPVVRVLSPDISVTDRRLLSAGAIQIVVERDNPEVPTDLWIRVGTSTIPHADDGARWTATIDPRAFVPIPPKTLAIDIEACAAGDRVACTITRLEVLIERRSWGAQLPVIRAWPALSSGTVVLGDRQGALHVLSLATGDELYPAVELAAPLSRPILIAADLMVAIDGAGTLHARTLSSGAPAWTAAVGTGATAAIYDELADRILVGAGTKLLAFSLSGTRSELHDFATPIKQAPLADVHGVVAVDESGHAVFFDRGGTLIAEAELGAAAVVPPVRQGASTVFFSATGAMVRFPTLGETLSLSPPPFHAPVLAGETLVVAFGDRLAFVREGEATIIDAAGPITGAPLPWPEGQAVIIGISGRSTLVKLVAEDGTQRIVSRTDGPPLPGLLRETPRQVLIPQNTGALEMFELEEGFF